MIKPFTVVETIDLADGMRRVSVLVRKHERFERGVRTHEMRCVVFVPADRDVDDFIMKDLKSQGWC